MSQDTPGLKRWLLSQAESLTVLSPQSLIDDVKTLIEKMQGNYIDLKLESEQEKILSVRKGYCDSRKLKE